MSAQSSLKARARAILGHTTERVIPAQYDKKAAHYPHIAQRIGNLKSADIEKIKAWLNQIGEPENERNVVIEKCTRDPEALSYFLKLANDHARSKRQEKVQAMLKAHPEKKRAYITETESDAGNVILTIAMRGAATFEMIIEQSKYDPFLLAEMIDKDLIH